MQEAREGTRWYWTKIEDQKRRIRQGMAASRPIEQVDRPTWSLSSKRMAGSTQIKGACGGLESGIDVDEVRTER